MYKDQTQKIKCTSLHTISIEIFKLRRCYLKEFEKHVSLVDPYNVYYVLRVSYRDSTLVSKV